MQQNNWVVHLIFLSHHSNNLAQTCKKQNTSMEGSPSTPAWQDHGLTADQNSTLFPDVPDD
jgi:hypothetical protein